MTTISGGSQPGRVSAGPVSGMPSQLDRPSRANTFEIVSGFRPTGDQPAAIDQLVAGVNSGERHQVLLGATGTGKTFTMANVVARTNRPTLVISHNKTLAAQLYEELREFFPNNSVNYFVSYYDYYQPEAYIPGRDIYIEKDASRNDDLDQLRLAATSNLLSRRDTIVVASVSCIFGLGSPSAYSEKVLTLTRGSEIGRRDLFLALNAMQYQRSDIDFKRGSYRPRGDAVEVWPAYEKFAVRVELFGDEIDRVELINPTTGELLSEADQFFLFPAVHYVMPEDQLQVAISGIRDELDTRVTELRSQGKLLEAQRLLSRTKYDLEMIQEVGFCSGIENYSRYMDGRSAGERPFTLLDYFDYAPPAESSGAEGYRPLGARDDGESGTRPTNTVGRDDAADAARYGITRRNRGDWLLIIDESHVTVPQIQAMYNGDRARKEVLVEHGFRLPSALDNRPIRFEEFEAMLPQAVYVSATPGAHELERAEGVVAEQVIRPTGLLDPEVEIRPARDQVPDLVGACRERVGRGDRVLVTALTKRLCEDLTNYLADQGLEVRYLHSEIDTLDRVVLLQELRQGEFDVLVGVNLLREGLDLPEVSLVCILDADKEGYLRSATSLIQTMGRAARNAEAKVILYADSMTKAMQQAIEETDRRRAKQKAFNEANGIVPQTVRKAVRAGLEADLRARRKAREDVETKEPEVDARELLEALENEMVRAAEQLEFEKAATLRDKANAIKLMLEEHANEAEATGKGSPDAGGAAAEQATKPLMIRPSELDGVGGSGKGKGRRGKKKKSGMPGVRTAGTRRGSRK